MMKIYKAIIESFALFDHRLLKGLFIKGYINLVVRILVQLLDKLKNLTAQSTTRVCLSPNLFVSISIFVRCRIIWRWAWTK